MKCSKCNLEKELSCFYKDSRKKNGFKSYCKICDKNYKRTYVAIARGRKNAKIMNAIDFLKNKEILQEGFEKWIVKFTDGKEFNIVELLEEYSNLNNKPKSFNIDFCGKLLAGLQINNNTPFVFGAMDGGGNGINVSDISIYENPQAE